MIDGAPGATPPGRSEAADRGPVVEPPRHPCRLSPVVQQVGAYLAGPDASPEAQQDAACGALRNARGDFERFVASTLTGTALVSVELSITAQQSGADRDAVSVYTHLPSPLTLLLVCARNCEEGDLVGLRQRTAKCGEMYSEARWPFGLAEAEVLTRPATAAFAELQAGDADRVRRHERVVRGLGRVVTEREATTRVWWPRVGRWTHADGARSGWSWGWGTTQVRFARLR
jgi:hypothetical protein